MADKDAHGAVASILDLHKHKLSCLTLGLSWGPFRDFYYLVFLRLLIFNFFNFKCQITSKTKKSHSIPNGVYKSLWISYEIFKCIFIFNRCNSIYIAKNTWNKYILVYCWEYYI